MENLLKPDYGVLALTVCNFLLLVYLLKKFAWGPIINALEKREQQIAADKQTAAQARQSAEELKKELDTRLAQISNEASAQIAKAVSMGRAQQEQLIDQAKQQAQQLLEQAKAQIEAEKNKALADVRGEISSISLLAASRILGKQVKDDTADQVVSHVLEEITRK